MRMREPECGQERTADGDRRDDGSGSYQTKPHPRGARQHRRAYMQCQCTQRESASPNPLPGHVCLIFCRTTLCIPASPCTMVYEQQPTAT